MSRAVITTPRPLRSGRDGLAARRSAADHQARPSARHPRLEPGPRKTLSPPNVRHRGCRRNLTAVTPLGYDSADARHGEEGEVGYNFRAVGPAIPHARLAPRLAARGGCRLAVSGCRRPDGSRPDLRPLPDRRLGRAGVRPGIDDHPPAARLRDRGALQPTVSTWLHRRIERLRTAPVDQGREQGPEG